MAEAKPYRNPSGAVVFRVQYSITVDGHRKNRQKTFDTKAAADEFAALGNKWSWVYALDVYDKRTGAQTAPTETLRSFVDKYLNPTSGILTGVQVGTRNGYRSAANNSFLPMLGDFPIDAITRDHVGAWVTWQEQQPARYGHGLVAAKTVKGYHGLLSNIFSAAVERGLRPDNPARRIKLTEGVQREGVFLTRAQFLRILDAIPERHKGLIILLAATGARWGEATALTWADINEDTTPPTIRINKAWKKADSGFKVGPTKTRAARRTVAVEAPVIARLGPRGQPGELVFHSPVSHNRLRYSAFREDVWVPTIRRLNEDDNPLGVTPNIHDLRHTHASWLIADGHPLSSIRVRLGHEKITTTDGVYGHLLPDAHTRMAGTVGFLGQLEP